MMFPIKMFSIKPRLALALSAIALAGLTAAQVAQAAPPAKTVHTTRKAGPPKRAATVFYVCNDCHVFYTAAAAKKAGYKDSMGDKMVKVTKVPAGYMDGAKMKM
jgi:hypothetical protein